MQKENPELNLADVLARWWRKRKPIACGMLCGLVIGLTIALLYPKAYAVTVKMIAETGSSGLSDELSGLTSLVGINFTGLRSEEQLNPSLYAEIVASVPFLAEMSEVFIRDSLLSAYVPGFGGEAVRIGHKGRPTRREHKLVESLRKNMAVTTDRQNGLTAVAVTLIDPQAAAVAADSLVAKLERYLITARLRKARADFNFIRDRFGEAKANYYTAQDAYARFQDVHRHTAKESAAVEGNRLYQEQQLAYNVYSQLAGQLEVARLKVQERTPVLTVIEPAIEPVRHSSPRRSLIVLAGLLLGAAVPMAYFTGQLLFQAKNPHK